MKAPLPLDEPERLKALRRYEILDTGPEQEFDDITLLASTICGAPIAMISLVDEGRQWFKSKIGMTESETSRDIAFCAHGILQQDVFVVNDARADQRFADNPLVTGKSGIRFYAGAPLLSSDGHALGMLCVNDRVPRDLNAEQKASLKALSRQVVAQLEWRRSVANLRQTVAELQRTQEFLRQSEQKFIQLTDNITDVFWMTSPDMQTMYYVSPAYETIWGRSVLSLRDNPLQWAEAILPEDRERALATLSRLANEASVDAEFRIVRPDGMVRWIVSRGFQVKDAADKVIRITGIASDITERKKAEESLRLLTAAVEQSKEAIVITDSRLDLPGPAIVFVNPAFTRMTGYSAEEAIGKTPRILQGSHTDKKVLARLRQNLQQGQGFEGETINYRKDGTEFNLEWQIAPIRNVDGITTHFVAIQRDISARKRLEAQLFQSQKMETVGKLAGGIAHEFNSILTVIIGQTELILGDLPPDSPLLKNAGEISKAAGRAATLTRQLLAYGRKQILQPEALDLNRIITGMEGTFNHLMGGDIFTHIELAPDLHAIKADAGQVEQVIMNMVINARDAMPNGGKLTLETANVSFEQESSGRYPELRAGDYVMLAITDTGTGMVEEVKLRVFEPFFSTKAVGQGSGLGLSTCYGIVKQSGGHITVYSEIGRGSTFKIYLPQVKQEAKLPLPRRVSSDLPRGTETILLVEDDPALRELASTVLRRLGYTVLSAANGIEALSLKQKRGTGYIDLLFTDVVMPHMSGKELAERVLALYPHTRVLFTSAYTENSIVHQGVLNKGVALLQKPFTPSALARKLREVLDPPPNPEPLAGSSGSAKINGENTP